MRSLRKSTPGLSTIAHALVLALLQPWLLVGAAYAAYDDQTELRLPVDGDDSYDFAVADVDGDGDLDVLVANRGQSRLLLNDGTGTFSDETAARLGSSLHTTLAVAFGDVDGVNGVDAWLVGEGQNRLLINNGSGVFSDQTGERLPVEFATSLDVALGDMDGDGDLDAVVANRGSANRLLLNDGSGQFAAAAASRLDGDSDFTYGVAVGDVNGDGSLDVFFANFAGQNRLHLNNNLGFFTDVTAARLPAAVTATGDAVMFDADGDGDRDIATADGIDGVGLLINDGSGRFTEAAPGAVPAVASFAVKVAAGDVDFDGAPDLLVGMLGQDRLLRNDGAGSFADVSDTELPADDRRSFGIALLDADADLDLDLLVATPQSRNRYYDNAIAAPRILVEVAPDYIEVTDTVTVTVSVFDEDGVAATGVEIVQPDFSSVSPTDLGGGVYSFVPTQIGVHTVRVTSTDALGNASTREARFLAQENDVTAPSVAVSVDPTTVVQGQSALFTVTATDDRGVVGSSLTVGGEDVPLDSSGQATYAPLATGTLTVTGEAVDAAGNSGVASTTITVLADTDAPVVTLTATPDPVDITNPISISAAAADNVAVASLEVTVTGPGGSPTDEPVTLDGDGIGSYTPFLPGIYTFTARALDPAGNLGEQMAIVEAQGVPDDEPPVVNLSVVPGTTIPGGTVTLTVDATDNVYVAGRSLEVNGAPIVLDGNHQADFVAPALGDYTAVATATDPSGNVGSATVTFSAVDPATDTSPPVVEISAPAEGSEITNLAEFSGTATDLTLVSYELAYRRTGSSDAFTTFVTGSRVVENGVLGSLDTSVLDNGLYDVRLTASDINGLSSSVTKVFTVDGGFKPGIFTISYTDLTVPVAGIPISIRRTYDSRRRGERQDFGQGWDLEVVQSGTYTNNRPLGEGWTGLSGGGPLGLPCQGGVREDVFHITEIRFSDTEFYKFAFEITLTGAFSSLGCEVASVGFTQVGGIPGATLDVLAPSASLLNVAGGELFDYDTLSVYNPTDVRLTTLDDREYDLNLDDGVTRIGDSHGNSLFVSTGGVVHSSGVSVGFTRDGAGRITAITDPAGNALAYGYDGNGDLATVTDRADNVTSYFYLADHYLDRIVDPEGNTPLRNEYDESGRLIAQIDAAGNRNEFDHNIAGSSETLTDRDGVVRVLQYDEAGNVASTTVGAASSSYTYDGRGNKLTETDPNGHTTSFTYNAADQMTSETDPAGNVTSYGYDAEGRIAQMAAAGGVELNFGYDAAGNVTEQRDADGNLIQGLTYDGAGNPTSVTTAAGTTNLTYDGQGRVAQVTAPDGLVRSYTYDALGRTLTSSVTRTVGGSPVVETTAYSYDGNGNVLTVTDPAGHVTTYTYDGNDRRATMTDALGRVTTYEYDARGNLFRVTYPDTTTEIHGYDLENRKTAFTDTAGRTTFFEYDSGDRLARVIYPDGGTTVNTFDAGGNLMTQTDTLGNTTTYAYDAADRVISETDALGNVTTYTYVGDQVKPATVTDPRGNVTSYSYDTSMLFSEYLVQTTLPDGNTVQREYGANGRMTSRTDANGRATSYGYDPAARLQTVTDPAGNTTTYSYDEVGNRLSQTDALGRTTAFTYDAMGRMLSKTLPGGQTASWTYDAVGNVLSHTDFNGETTSYEYDSRDRLTRQVFPDTSEETYTYTGSGQLATVSNVLGTWTFSYDGRDRLVSAISPDGVTLTYTYDTGGNRTSVVSPAGTVAYTYDELDRVATVTDPSGGVTGYSYDAAGNIVGIDYPNGTAAVLEYDSRNRTVRVTHLGPGGAPVLADYQYDLDAVGNRIQVVEAAGRTLDFSYDVLNRLTGVVEDPSGAALVSDYDYDAVGNLISIAVPGSSQAATYDVNDRLLTFGTRSFAYDANGNLTTITDGSEVTLFEYDARNRLVRRIEPDGTASEFDYDHDGNRISRTVDGVATGYAIDRADPSGLAQVLLERDGGGAVTASYVHGHGPISMHRGALAWYYHPDALGSTRALTDGAGTVTDRYAYDPWGNDAGTTGSTPNEIRYAGQRLDPASGLYYLRARYYDPEIARFITRDPYAGDPLVPVTLHPYQYAFDNPVNAIDPTGEFSMISISISISIASTLASIAYNKIYKPAKEVYDEIEEIAVNIPNMRLNEEASAEELGFTPETVVEAIDEEDITALVNLGGGAVEKAYGVLYKMTTTTGQAVSLIHALNSATWMTYLPVHEEKPAHYVSCEFNHFVKKEYGLGLVTSLAAAKRFSQATNVIGIYLAYFTFLALVGSTAGDTEAKPQPADDPSLFGDEPACPGLFK